MRRILTLFCPWLIAFLMMGALTAIPSSAEDGEAAVTRDDIESIIEEYLIDNPDIVIRALEAWEQQREERKAEQARLVIESRDDEIYNDPETPSEGDPDGGIVIVEFFDYQCGYCRLSAPDLFTVRDGIPGIRLIYKEFPILGEDSIRTARAALAAREQGLYESFHHALMIDTDDFSQAGLMAAAEAVGLDSERLAHDMNDPDIDAYLERTRELATALGINGTPAFIINGDLYPGALRIAQFEQIIGTSVR